MSDRSNGGPAFARPLSGVSEEMAIRGITADAQEGLSLRDYLAAAALTGMVARANFHLFQGDGMESDLAARNAYELADAMLKARGG